MLRVKKGQLLQLFFLLPTLLSFFSHKSKTTVMEYLDVNVVLESLNLTVLLDYLNLTALYIM